MPGATRYSWWLFLVVVPTEAARRTRTEQVDRALEQALSGANVEEILRRMSQADQDLFWELVASLRHSGCACVSQ